MKERKFVSKDLVRIIKKHLEKKESDLVWQILRRSGACELSVDDLIYIICTNLQPTDAKAFYERLLANNPCGFLYHLSAYSVLNVYDHLEDKVGFLRALLVEKRGGDWIEHLEKTDVDWFINRLFADPNSPSFYPAVSEVCRWFTFINDNLMLLSTIAAGMLAIPVVVTLAAPFVPPLVPWVLPVDAWFASFGVLIFVVAQSADHLNQMFNWVFMPAFKCGDYGTAVPKYILPPMPEIPSGFPLESGGPPILQ